MRPNDLINISNLYVGMIPLWYNKSVWRQVRCYLYRFIGRNRILMNRYDIIKFREVKFI